jgi:hypothetical protein
MVAKQEEKGEEGEEEGSSEKQQCWKPPQKSRKPNCSRRLSSLARKEEYSPISLSLSTFSSERL